MNKMNEFWTLNKPIKVIFLDIDGVVMTGKYMKYQTRKWRNKGKPKGGLNDRGNKFDQFAFKLLINLLKDNQDIYIVISSTWRLDYFSNNMGMWKNLRSQFLNVNQYHRIIGITENSNSRIRELEINNYLLTTQNDIINFCVIDDDSFDLQSFIGNKLIKTRFNSGLLPRHIDQIYTVLKL